MHLQTIDFLIIITCLSALFGGFRLGFVARVLSWLGMAVGFAIAIAVLPYILRGAPHLSSSSRLAVVIILMLVGVLLGQMLGLLAGSRLSSTLPPGPMRTTDRVVGSIAGVLGVLLILWLVLPTAANVPGWSAQQVHSSQIAQAVYNNMPRPPNAVQTLNRLVGSSSFPSVFQDLTPAYDTGPPPESVTLPADVLERVKGSTVKVEGQACRRTQDGSGFVVGPHLVATNAHVVAGEKKTNIITNSGDVMSATVVLYDPQRDLALLSVPRLDAEALPIGDPNVGDTGAVFGHPGGQAPLAVSPAAVRRQIMAVGRDLYDNQTTRRDVLILASALQQGDSGGALINTKGDVIGVAFAIAPDKPGTSYALNTSELRAVLAEPHNSPVSTQTCVND